MSTSKFRGKCNDKHSKKFCQWIFGGVCDYESGIDIIEVNSYDGSLYDPPYTDFEEYEVDRETVGQFTSRKDMGGVDIYEGDILYIRWGKGFCVTGKAVVYFDEERLQYRVRSIDPKCTDDCGFDSIVDYEVIGNIYDNQGLLKE